MSDDAGDQRSALLEYDHEEIPDGYGVAHLQQSGKQLRTVQQVDDMADAEGERADQNGNGLVVLCHHFKEIPAENDLLDEADVQHGQNVKKDLLCAVVDMDPAPEIDGNDQDKGEKIQVLFAVFHPFQSVVCSSSQKSRQGEKPQRKERIDRGAYKALGAEILHTERIDRHVQRDQNQAKQRLVLFKKFFHHNSPPLIPSCSIVPQNRKKTTVEFCVSIEILFGIERTGEKRRTPQ